MAPPKLPYDEGDWFNVPLRTEGFAVGLVVRRDGRGIVVGYFFGRRFSSTSSIEDVAQLETKDAVLICRFGDLGLLNGQWPIIGKHLLWTRAEWPLPRFVRTDAVSGALRLITYSEEDLSEIGAVPCTRQEAEGLPQDGMFGFGAVEIKLTKLLDEKTVWVKDGR